MFVVEYLAVLRASARTRGGLAAGQLARIRLEHIGRTARLVYLDLRRRPTLRAGPLIAARLATRRGVKSLSAMHLAACQANANPFSWNSSTQAATTFGS